MSLNVKTLEAKDIQSNQMTFCGELTDLGEHELALCYFEYSKNKDMSDAVNSTRCALLDRPGVYEFIQDNLDDNSNYYFRAAVQNFEETESQIEYLRNIDFSNRGTEYFDREKIMRAIINSPELLTSLLSDKDSMYNAFSSNNLDMLWTGDINEIGDSYVQVYALGHYDTKNITLANKIDLNNKSTLKIDWTCFGGPYIQSRLYINNNRIWDGYKFDRKIQCFNIADINILSDIKVQVYNDTNHSDSKYHGGINVYGLWLE